MCSIIVATKLGFGGKMCIDGTKKFEEEIDDSYQPLASENSVTEDLLKQKFDEIRAVNVSLLKKIFLVLIISIEKNKKGHVRQLHDQICAVNEMQPVKMSIVR